MNNFMRSAVIVTVAIFFILSAANGVFGSEEKKLDLRECARTGIENSFRLQSYDSKSRYTDARVKEVSAAKNPHVSINGSSAFQQPEVALALQSDPQAPPVKAIAIPKWYHSYTLAVTQLISSFGKIEMNEKYVKMDEVLINFQKQSETDKLLFDITEAYYRVMLAKELLDIADAQHQMWQEQYKTSESMFNRGAVAKYDLLRIKVSLSKSEENIITAQKDLEIAKGSLETLMGVKYIFDNSGVIYNDFWVNKARFEQNAGEWKKIAAEQNPVILLGKAAVEQSDYAIGLAKLEMAPSLMFQTGYGRNSATFATEDWSWKNSVSLNLPIGDGGERKAKIAQARELKTQAQLNLADTNKNIMWDVEKACLQMKELKAKQITAGEQLESASETFRVASLRYTSGLGTMVELTDASANLVTAQSQIKQINYSIQIQSAIISYSCGTINQEIFGSAE